MRSNVENDLRKDIIARVLQIRPLYLADLCSQQRMREPGIGDPKAMTVAQVHENMENKLTVHDSKMQL